MSRTPAENRSALFIASETLNRAVGELGRLDTLRPPCPICKGDETYWDVIDDPVYGSTSHCPDCDDGKVSWEQMAHRWNVVEDFLHEGPRDLKTLRHDLRAVKP